MIKTSPTASTNLRLNFNQQCLRILRCTAKALASSPGGLRFTPDTQPWLEGLPSLQRVQLMAIK